MVKSRRSPLVKAVATVGGLTMLSRIFGFLRDMLIAALFGGGWIFDAFIIALKIPNLFRRLFGEGAFSIAFVPAFSRILYAGQKDGDKVISADNLHKAQNYAGNVFVLMCLFLGGLLILFEIFMPIIVMIIAPGMIDDPKLFDHVVALSRLTAPYLPFICLVAMLGGVLNSFDRFGAMAATPVMFNICLILTVLAIAPWAGNLLSGDIDPLYLGYILAGAVSVSGVIQLIWMIWQLKRGHIQLPLRKPRMTPETKDLGRVMTPALLSHGVMQLNLLVDTMIASFLIEGSISYLFLADRLTQLPLGVIGVALSTAILPKLSRALGENDHIASQNIQSQAFAIAGLLTLPAAAGLFMLHDPIVSVLFERGAFDAADSQATAGALQIFALGLPAFVLSKILTTSYYARQDTKTPLKLGVVAMGINIVCALSFISSFGHIGLAMATVIAGWLNAAMLAIGLYRTHGQTFQKQTILRWLGQISACFGMAAILWLLSQYASAAILLDISQSHLRDVTAWIAFASWVEIFWLGLAVGVGGLSYLGLSFLTRGLRRSDLAMIRRR